MVMENQEMAMEKSWKNILSSLWKPCVNLIRIGSLKFFFVKETSFLFSGVIFWRQCSVRHLPV